MKILHIIEARLSAEPTKGKLAARGDTTTGEIFASKPQRIGKLHQIQRLLDCSMETGRFLSHRVREMMNPGNGTLSPIGAQVGRKKGRAPAEKVAVCRWLSAMVRRAPTIRQRAR